MNGQAKGEVTPARTTRAEARCLPDPSSDEVAKPVEGPQLLSGLLNSLKRFCSVGPESLYEYL